MLFLLGCAPIIRSEQPSKENKLLLNNDNPVGQTFLSKYDGLNGILVSISPIHHANGEIVLDIKYESEDSSPIRSASINFNDVTEPKYYQFSFPIIDDSAGEDYYFELSIIGSGEAKVGAGPAENYLYGSAYSGSNPIDNQVSFRLQYDQFAVVMGLIKELLRWAIIVVLCTLLFIIPGWALLIWLLPSWRKLDWGEKIGISAGSSLALYPIILVLFHLANLQLGKFFLILPIAGLIFVIWNNRSLITKIRNFLGKSRNNNREPQIQEQRWGGFRQFVQKYLPEILLILILGLILSVRYWNIRLVEAPLWGDSYQHSMIAQLLVNNNGLTSSWLPYAPYQSLTVHFGFPAIVAFFQWLTDIPNSLATLYVGQILNALAALALYPLAIRMSGGNRWAGLGAVIVSGVLLPIPAIYTNWGRYAQLAGQAILPIGIWICLECLKANRKGPKDPSEDNKIEKINPRHEFLYDIAWREAIIAGIVIAGMTLTYYRMPFYLGAFLIAWLIIWGIGIWRSSLRQWGYSFIRLILIISIAIVLILPWTVNLTGSELAGSVGSGLATRAAYNNLFQDYQVWRNLDVYVPSLFIILILAAIIIGLLSNYRLILTLFLWFLFLLAFIMGQLVGLPGAVMIQNFAILIAIYIPISLLLGWLFGFIIDYAKKFDRRFGQIIAVSLVIFAGFWGAWNQRNIINEREFALVLRPDAEAMDWIKDNTPLEANFLVEGFRIYGGTSAVGSDAGWWIPLLAGRKNSMPPQYALLNEVPIDPEYSQSVVDLVATLEESSPNSEESLKLICDNKITHIFIGQRQGKVGAGVTQLISPEMLAKNPAYQLIYHQDRVHIYEIDPNLCSQDG